MKRDMDLVRSILMQLEEHRHGWAPERFAVQGHSEEEVRFHVHLMAQAWLVRTKDVTCTDSDSPGAVPTSITWAGYEFLDLAREPSIWDKAKSRVLTAVGGIGLELLKETLRALSKEKLGLH